MPKTNPILTERINIKLSKEQKETLIKLAEEANLTVSLYIRKACFNPETLPKRKK